MELHYLAPHIQSVCIPRSEMGFLQTVYIGIFFLSIQPIYVIWFEYLAHLHLRP